MRQLIEQIHQAPQFMVFVIVLGGMIMGAGLVLIVGLQYVSNLKVKLAYVERMLDLERMFKTSTSVRLAQEIEHRQKADKIIVDLVKELQAPHQDASLH